MSKEIVGIDIFCGCGGMTHGLIKAGIKIVKGIDIVGSLKETYEKNNPGTTFVNSDIRKLSLKKLKINRRGKYLLVAGCAPCQPFSKYHNDSKYDKRKSLIIRFAEIIEELLPEFILIENVPGFKSINNEYHKKFIKILKKLGYYFDEGILNAADYGVPQRRNRFVLLGSLLGEIRLPKSTHGTKKRKHKTVKDTIKKYPKIKAGQKNERILNHYSFKLSPTNLKRISSIPKNGGTRVSLSPKLSLACHNNFKGHTDVYGRMKWNEPSPTLTCKCTSLSNGRFGHPQQNRAISVREAAALQTFPDNYRFYDYETYNTQYIGNAVPVTFAKKLGRQIVKAA